jgi:predicted HTH domain antitoxin
MEYCGAGGEAMGHMTIQIDDDVLWALKIPAEETGARLRQELALRLYEKGLLTVGKARELAQMSRWAFHDLLGEEGICRRYDTEELESDLRTLEILE